MSKKIDLCQKPSEFFKERVSEVMTRVHFSTTEIAEFYIVDLLGRFMVTSNLFDKYDDARHVHQDPLAIQLLNAHKLGVNEAEKIRALKKLGDTSLYISGFFSDSLNRKVVDLDYYREMGAIAYRGLSDAMRDSSFQELYKELYSKFGGFVEILCEVSHEVLPQTDQSLLRLYEVYVKTGSEAAKKFLQEKGLPTPMLAQAPKDKINKS